MPNKQKNVKKSKAVKGLKRPKKVELAVSSASKLRSFRLVHHRHTGQLLHYRHTSHLALLCILAIVGLFIYASQAITRASLPPINHDITVSAEVSGNPPTVGATITSPLDGATIAYQPTFQIDGTCAENLFVVVYSNSNIVGSTTCTSAGIFRLYVQLSSGKNVLSAKNFDNINQPGPATPSVTVFIDGGERFDQLAFPLLPTIPKMCDNYSPPIVPSGGAARVAVVCMPRLIEANTGYVLGLVVWGGEQPYALSIDWGDGTTENTLLSLTSNGYKTVGLKYAKPGSYHVIFRLKDKDGNAAFVETVVVVNGEVQPFFAGIKDGILHISWFETPVPLYLLAVALTLGFWGGDLFDRRFGITKAYKKTRHRAA